MSLKFQGCLTAFWFWFSPSPVVLLISLYSNEGENDVFYFYPHTILGSLSDVYIISLPTGVAEVGV